MQQLCLTNIKIAYNIIIIVDYLKFMKFNGYTMDKRVWVLENFKR